MFTMEKWVVEGWQEDLKESTNPLPPSIQRLALPCPAFGNSGSTYLLLAHWDPVHLLLQLLFYTLPCGTTWPHEGPQN